MFLKTVSSVNDFIRNIKQQLDNLAVTCIGGHIKTIEIRKLSNRLYRDLNDKSMNHVFSICSELLEQREWALGVIAYDFAYRVKKQYDDETFSIFESWLTKYVGGWGDCDDFCTHAFGELLMQKPELFSKIILWTERKEFWMRRAAAVILIPSILNNQYCDINLTHISDQLMHDDNYLVLKGYGWMLKVLSQNEPLLVYNYLLANKEIMPRISFRYALGKLDKSMKYQLMNR